MNQDELNRKVQKERVPFGEMFNRAFKDTNRGYEKSDYVPLDERDDWDGKVEVLE